MLIGERQWPCDDPFATPVDASSDGTWTLERVDANTFRVPRPCSFEYAVVTSARAELARRTCDVTLDSGARASVEVLDGTLKGDGDRVWGTQRVAVTLDSGACARRRRSRATASSYDRTRCAGCRVVPMPKLTQTEARVLYRKLENAVDHHRAVPYLRRLEALDLSVYVHERNSGDLRGLVQAHVHPANFLKVWAWKDRPQLRAGLRELTRLLHNHVASADAIVDQAHYVTRQHYGPDFKAKFATQHNLLKGTPVVAFLCAVRNHVMHAGPLPVTASFTGTTGTSLTLDREKVRAMKHVKGAAKTYADGIGPDGVDLVAALTAHDRSLTEFHRWFRRAIEQQHYRDLADYRALVVRLRKAAQISGYLDD